MENRKQGLNDNLGIQARENSRTNVQYAIY